MNYKLVDFYFKVLRNNDFEFVGNNVFIQTGKYSKELKEINECCNANQRFELPEFKEAVRMFKLVKNTKLFKAINE